MSDAKKVSVKILKHVGAWVPGQVVEVDEAMAKHLCHVNELTDGITSVKHVRAMLLEDALAAEEAAKDIGGLTSAEAKAMGIKNVTDSSSVAPKLDPEAELKKQAEAELAAEEAAKKGKGKK